MQVSHTETHTHELNDKTNNKEQESEEEENVFHPRISEWRSRRLDGGSEHCWGADPCETKV